MLEFLKKSGSWVITAITIISLLSVLFLGGKSEDGEITGKNGNIYSIDYNMDTGILELIEKCDLKKEGESCEIILKVKVTLKKLNEQKNIIKKEETKDDIKIETLDN